MTLCGRTLGSAVLRCVAYRKSKPLYLRPDRLHHVTGVVRRAQNPFGVSDAGRRGRYAHQILWGGGLELSHSTVVKEFCKISLEFIRKGTNSKLYQSAGREYMHSDTHAHTHTHMLAHTQTHTHTHIHTQSY